ncbi:MAG TPA: hypothetical protein VFM80_00485 [Gracilimonas sp.]|uniref:hypothetical protein n=1 Tax=Gracilimonas sp. TaxID=1974203 RepID=UPI002D8A09C5|nr:hypothetical protein [Gracilimonas sp.]
MKKFILTILVLVFTSVSAFPQQSSADWEYPSYPDLPFALNHIQMDLSIDKESSLIKGVGNYELTVRRPGVTEIIFNTSDLDVRGISINGNEAEFSVSSDSLIIQLPDTAGVGERIELRINWESSSPYGIHKDVYGNLWTSLNPKSRHHWLPIPDHPEVTTTLEASVTIPADNQIIFNGRKVGDEVISTEEKVVEWRVENAIPVSGISFVIGNFTEINARSGVKEIGLFAPESALLPEVRDGLLTIAVETLKSYEQKLSFEFPYESLNIVVLPDHHWEEIQSGAGIIYLYKSLGSLSTQLRRGIAEQWFGNYNRYLNAPDNKYEFLKVLLAGSSQTEQLANSDNLQSIYRWNLWERGIESMENDFLKNTISGSLPQLIKNYSGVTDWNDYADFWYGSTGAYWEVLPDIQLQEKVGSEEKYVYNVEYVYDELNATLMLVFEANGEPIESLIGVEVMEYGFTDTARSELTFTGALDSVSVNISSGIDYLTLTPDTELDLELDENKPFLFWIRQLRSSNPEDQIQAATELQNFADNPDLQLALRDVLTIEENPDVRAALLETLSVIMKDASGTEQTFLGNLNSDDLAIRLSGLRALSNYQGNENVKYAVRNALLRTEQDTVFNTALNTYKQIAATDALISLAEQFEQSEQGDKKAMKVLKVTAPVDTTRQSMTIADRFALGNYPYSIRKEALKLLMEFEENEDYWLQTLEMLQEDRDPRIRYISLNAIGYLSDGDAENLLKNRESEELDPRVLRKIRELQN